MPPNRTWVGWRRLRVVVLCALLAAGGWLVRTSFRPATPASTVRDHFAKEDWPAVLAALASDPLTNAVERLAVVRALFEAQRLPDDLFSWIHQPGPELLSTAAFRSELGMAYAAAIALELGQVNIAERWAFDSLEMEGENPTALRVLARLHVLKGLPQAASVFLNRLAVQPEHHAWAMGLRTLLATDPAATTDPDLSRLRSGLVARDELVTRLSTDTVLWQAYQAHPERSMNFHFFMVQHLLARRVAEALHTLDSHPQIQEAPLPRHYAEVVLLHDHGVPEGSPARLRQLVPAAVAARFEEFKRFMDRGAAGREAETQAEAWRAFGDTYWYYHFFGSHHSPHTQVSAPRTVPPFQFRPEPSATADTRTFTPAIDPPLRIVPDYADVVIPPNLAPLNLTIQEPGTEYRLRLAGPRGSVIELQQTSPHLRLPLQQWQELLESNRGEILRWQIAIRDRDDGWADWYAFTNRVAEEPIDSHLLYRRLGALFSYYKNLGIYQRNLETFEETPVLRNTALDQGCLNCHTFAQGQPDHFVIPLRTPSGTPTLLVQSNQVSWIEHRMGYPTWHPNGRLIAFSANTISQFFHVAGSVNRDIWDPHSDLAVCDLTTGNVDKPPAIARPDHSENWPCWAPDGRHLYYCSAPTLAFRHQQHFRYDLLRIPYDPDQNQWGEPETLFAAADHRLSAHQPRVSPDGRLLVFTVSDSGSFPVFRSNSDLWLLDLGTDALLPLPINSDAADTWHSWSSNGRWLVFGSKRLDGVFTRVFITHVDSASQVSKPLLLPQEDPAYYETSLDNFNLPELIRGPLDVSEADIIAAFQRRPVRDPPSSEPSVGYPDSDHHP